MKKTIPVLCLAIVALVLVRLGERNLFFSDYPLFVAIFAALAVLVAATAAWAGADADDGTGQDDS